MLCPFVFRVCLLLYHDRPYDNLFKRQQHYFILFAQRRVIGEDNINY